MLGGCALLNEDFTSSAVVEFKPVLRHITYTSLYMLSFYRRPANGNRFVYLITVSSPRNHVLQILIGIALSSLI